MHEPEYSCIFMNIHALTGLVFHSFKLLLSPKESKLVLKNSTGLKIKVPLAFS